jgi:hypothetical protein
VTVEATSQDTAVEATESAEVRGFEDLGSDTQAALKAVVVEDPYAEYDDPAEPSEHEESDSNDGDDSLPQAEEDSAEVESTADPEEGEEEEEEEEYEEEVSEFDARVGAGLDKLRRLEAGIKEQGDAQAEAIKAGQAYQALSEGWRDDRVGTLRSHIAAAIGTDDPAALKQEISSLYEDLTLTVLDVPVDSDKQVINEVTKLRRELAQSKQEIAKAEAAKQVEAEKAQHAKAVSETVHNLGRFISDVAHEYPYLSRHEKAGEVVFEVMDQHLAQGESITAAEAAHLANEHFQTEAEKYRDLFAPAGGEPKTPSKQKTRRKSKAGSRTITNAQASESPNRKPRPKYIEDAEESKSASLDMLRQQLRDAEDDD